MSWEIRLGEDQNATPGFPTPWTEIGSVCRALCLCDALLMFLRATSYHQGRFSILGYSVEEGDPIPKKVGVGITLYSGLRRRCTQTTVRWPTTSASITKTELLYGMYSPVVKLPLSPCMRLPVSVLLGRAGGHRREKKTASPKTLFHSHRKIKHSTLHLTPRPVYLAL